MRSWFRWLGVPLAASVVAAGIGSAAGEAGEPPHAAPGPNGPAEVTLITGDRVLLAGTDVGIVPGKGRDKVTYRTQRLDGRVRVIPSDAAALLASGRLDPRLFDVTGLIEAGYGDRESRSIPLIVTYDGARNSLRGASTVRELPSVNGSAMRVSKGTDFLAGLPRSGQRFGGGVERVWLDGKRRTSLDQSVPQIGAPAAWQAGYTGKGATVAVLDTGIDDTHPDLAGRVVAAKNFTGDPDADENGHGTHVAATIAGTAKAAPGTYRGVAPDAQLLAGKVCDISGSCDESAVLAAMQWAAVERKADVVNLSLGGPDSPGLDPLEEAVNTLTAQTGTLFVIAAGNAGPDAGTVGSPGSADAALTVGAVDKQDRIARFSGRGPRVGDGGAKPDVTAPGVDIVAARAKDTEIGDPVGDLHVRASGTSMATPHVAGAAALLVQQHPEWTAADLKSVLMASAKPHADQGLFDQGTGRIDLAKAITQTVTSRPGSLSFGTIRWPHHDDAPVSKQLAYRNYGNTAVTLRLEAVLTGPDGRPAPAGALVLSATTLTIPAGGTAAVTVTSNTRHDGPNGMYTGRVVATGTGGLSAATPVTTDKEVESYDLTVTHVGTDGRPDGTAMSTLLRLDTGVERTLQEADGSMALRLPKADYLLQGYLFDQSDLYYLVQPIVRLDRNLTVTVDARSARPVRTTVPRPDATRLWVEARFRLESGGTSVAGGVQLRHPGRLFTASLGDPVSAPDALVAQVNSVWGVLSPEGSHTNSPYSYHLMNKRHGRFFDGFDRTVKDSELAKVTATHNLQLTDRQALKHLFGVQPGTDGGTALGLSYELPSRTTHYLEAGGTSWRTEFQEIDYHGTPPGPTRLASPSREYQAGRSYAERWNAAVFGPRIANGDAHRSGDRIRITLPMYSDQHGHPGFSQTDTASTRLYRAGKLLAESADSGSIDVENVPGAPAAFTLVSSATRPTYSTLSTRTQARWTFRSRTATGELPLWVVRYAPALDDRNAAERKPVSVVPVTLRAAPGAQPGELTSVEVWASGDDGKTWTKATVRRIADSRNGANCYDAQFATPKGAAHISLKAKAADSAGNTVLQTITRAYALR